MSIPDMPLTVVFTTRGKVPGDVYVLDEKIRRILVEPVERFLRFGPMRRSPEAMRAYDRQFPVSRVRLRIDSRFQRAMAQMALDLCEPWRIRRRGDREREWNEWNKRRAGHLKASSEQLQRYACWTGDSKRDAASHQYRRPAERGKLPGLVAAMQSRSCAA
jgi:hypothetical protein